MLMLLRASLIASFLLIAGCLGAVSSTVKSFVPVGLDPNTPIISQIDKQYRAPLFAVGPELDRQRNQSTGLGLVSQAELETYLNDQLDRLKIASGIEGLPGRVYLFADTSFGARASADGNIYIPYAVILDLESTDEVAALLAHELAHTIRGHSSTDLFVMVQKKALSASALFASLRKTDAGGMRDSDLQALQNTMVSLLVADGFINPGWTRLQEEEADKLGLDIMIAAGYNSDAMFALLDKVGHWEELNSQKQHERNAIIENALGSVRLTQDDTALGNALNSYFNQGATKVGAYVDSLNKNHDSAVSRYDSVLAYTDLHYGNVAAPALQTEQWDRIARGSSTKAMLQALERTGEARDAMARGDLRNGERLIKSAVSTQTNNQNFVRQTFFELRAAQSKHDSMKQNLEIGLAGEYPSFLLHVENIRLKQEPDDKVSQADAQQLLTTFDAYGRPADYYNRVVPLLDSAGLSGQVLALLTECMTKYAGEGISCSVVSAEQSQKNDLSYKALMNSLL